MCVKGTDGENVVYFHLWGIRCPSLSVFVNLSFAIEVDEPTVSLAGVFSIEKEGAADRLAVASVGFYPRVTGG